jgi:hypothetical protein
MKGLIYVHLFCNNKKKSYNVGKHPSPKIKKHSRQNFTRQMLILFNIILQHYNLQGTTKTK